MAQNRPDALAPSRAHVDPAWTRHVAIGSPEHSSAQCARLVER